ncbi:hypothetical protein [Dyadobacter sediminis]|uniref:Uncharacterized protein n=1 Tax=Dyadobacter sediminis TaxID=1493691 RepID=A0A5R9KBR4_9BACT|nr:hypothetical protein [Dyadobacter sediminis]TLU92192.1 hypothetical protein FEM55_15735 [Dyadobacter sediminis]
MIKIIQRQKVVDFTAFVISFVLNICLLYTFFLNPAVQVFFMIIIFSVFISLCLSKKYKTLSMHSATYPNDACDNVHAYEKILKSQSRLPAFLL